MHDVMTIEEVATYLQLGRRSVYRLARRGDLPRKKVLGRWRFHVRDIDDRTRAASGFETPVTANRGNGASKTPTNNDGGVDMYEIGRASCRERV